MEGEPYDLSEEEQALSRGRRTAKSLQVEGEAESHRMGKENHNLNMVKEKYRVIEWGRRTSVLARDCEAQSHSMGKENPSLSTGKRMHNHSMGKDNPSFSNSKEKNRFIA